MLLPPPPATARVARPRGNVPMLTATALLCGAFAGCCHTAATAEEGVPRMSPRIVFMGDSITDGFSYPLLALQALRTAGRPVPVGINAGIGGDTAAGMRARLDRDVLVFKPQQVTLSVGVNDAARSVPLAAYQADVEAILDRLQAAGVRVCLLTPSTVGDPETEARVQAMGDVVRALARARELPLADVHAAMLRAQEAGTVVLETDRIHPNFAGHRAMARAVLDAWGQADVAVPAILEVPPPVGLISPWRILPVPDAHMPWLDEETVRGMRPDATWTTLALPESEPRENWWQEQTRREGFALALEALAGKAPRYVGQATVTSPKARPVSFWTGAALHTIWLNGQCIHRKDAAVWTGYHAGRDRVPAELRAGVNQIVIETGGQFFLSIREPDAP